MRRIYRQLLFERPINELFTLFLHPAAWFAFGVAISQRHSLSAVVAYAPILPLTLFFFSRRARSGYAGSYLLIALFSLYEEPVGSSPIPGSSVIRLVVMAACGFWLLRGSTIAVKRLFYLGLSLIGYLVLTVKSDAPFSYGQAFSDLRVVFFAFFLICVDFSKPTALVIKPVVLVISGSLAGDLVNILFLRSLWENSYLSYSSVKYLLALPSIYFLLNKKNIIALIFISLTLPVMIANGARMVFLAYLLILFVCLVRSETRWWWVRVTTAVVFIFLILLENSGTFFQSFKVLNLFLIASSGLSVAEILSALDPVRFDTNLVFWRQELFELIFGNGFGAGLNIGATGLLTIFPGQSAFSLAELRSGMFFNFHDPWVDVGVRFGLLGVGILCFSIAKHVTAASNEPHPYLAWVFLAGTISGWYSASGVLSLLILFKFLKCSGTWKHQI